jgi:hypothetical protein
MLGMDSEVILPQPECECRNGVWIRIAETEIMAEEPVDAGPELPVQVTERRSLSMANTR